MKVRDLSRAELTRELKAGLFLRVGPFTVCLRTTFPNLAEFLSLFYADHPLSDGRDFADFHLRLGCGLKALRHPRLRVQVMEEGLGNLADFSPREAVAHFEWGLNWCINGHAHQYLILHAGIVARDDLALILPAESGDGKSTLCAALVYDGWRLLSDELGLISPADGTAIPLSRPIMLKGDSIGVIRALAPEAMPGSVFKLRTEGMMGALVKPPAESVTRAREIAVPRNIVFHKFMKHAPPRLIPVSKGSAFLRLARNAFNFDELELSGFETVGRLIDSCNCYEFSYGRIEDALETLRSLPVSQELPSINRVQE